MHSASSVSRSGVRNRLALSATRKSVSALQQTGSALAPVYCGEAKFVNPIPHFTLPCGCCSHAGHFPGILLSEDIGSHDLDLLVAFVRVIRSCNCDSRQI